MGGLLQKLLLKLLPEPQADSSAERQHVTAALGCCSTSVLTNTSTKMRTTIKKTPQKMTQVIWVDSRMRVSGSDSDFEISLRESVRLSDARVRIDKPSFSDSFYTADAGQNL